MPIKYPNLPVATPRPDCVEFIDIILGRRKSNRVPLVEYIVDDSIRKPVTTDMLGRQWVDYGPDPAQQKGYFDNFIEFWRRMGYDFVRFEAGLPFSEHRLITADTAEGVNRDRAWVDQHRGAIASFEDFEKYNWPKVEDYDFSAFEYIAKNLPEGMGLMTCHAGGPFEHLSAIMSVEGLCMALSDQPDLVQAVSDKVGELMIKFYARLLELPNVIALFQGDDMGYRTSTMVSPAVLRQYVLPWHKKFAEMAHSHKLPYFLHSCGQLGMIMDDLIDDVKIDAKHSYEDVIIPVEQFQEKYGDRIGVLGGVDVHILSAHSPDDVRKRVRHLKETCGKRGRYAVGAGNSVPSYVPMANYLAMVDEVLNKG